MKLASAVTVCLFAIAAAGPASAQTAPASGMTAPAAVPPLYKRFGGYDALAAVTDGLLQRLVSDAQFARFFGGHSTDSLKKIRQHIVDQLCAATGGPSTSDAT